MIFRSKNQRAHRRIIKRRHIVGVILGVMAFLFVVSLASCSQVKSAVAESVEHTPVQYYLAGEVDTTANKEITEQVLYLLEDVATPSDRIRIDYLANDQVQNVYSSTPDKQGLWQLADNLPTMPNTDSAFRSSLYTVAELSRQNPDTRVRAVLATDGSSEDEVINAILAASNTLSNYSNFQIAVVGISPRHRAKFSNGFSPISSCVQFAGTKAEIDSLFRSYQ